MVEGETEKDEKVVDSHSHIAATNETKTVQLIMEPFLVTYRDILLSVNML